MASGAAASGRSVTREAANLQDRESRVLPPPKQVLRAAREEGERTASADLSEPGINVVLPELGDPDVQRTGEGYAGQGAGDLGRLAAAVAVAGDDVRLHYPDPEPDAAGPWFVLEPLSGQLATVQRGTGEVQVTMDYREPTDGNDPGFADCLTEVREASDLSHPYYPVDRAVFTTGMMEYALADVEAGDDELTATFDVSTTPATDTDHVSERFESLDCVHGVSYEPVVDVERADPSPAVRGAVERAHRSVLGVATYEWIPVPTVFNSLPDDKVAFGLGGRGATEFSNEEYATCVDLLAESVENAGDAL